MGGDITKTYASTTTEEFGDLIGEDGEATHVYDAQANTDALLDDSGQKEAQYKYTAYGEVDAISIEGGAWAPVDWNDLPSDLGSNMLAGGKKQYYLDPDLETYFLGIGADGRFTKPNTSFLSEDPTRQAGGDVNLFRYVHNNPINKLDPSGHRDPEGRFTQTVPEPAPAPAAPAATPEPAPTPAPVQAPSASPGRVKPAGVPSAAVGTAFNGLGLFAASSSVSVNVLDQKVVVQLRAAVTAGSLSPEQATMLHNRILVEAQSTLTLWDPDKLVDATGRPVAIFRCPDGGLQINPRGYLAKTMAVMLAAHARDVADANAAAQPATPPAPATRPAVPGTGVAVPQPATRPAVSPQTDPNAPPPAAQPAAPGTEVATPQPASRPSASPQTDPNAQPGMAQPMGPQATNEPPKSATTPQATTQPTTGSSDDDSGTRKPEEVAAPERRQAAPNRTMPDKNTTPEWIKQRGFVPIPGKDGEYEGPEGHLSTNTQTERGKPPHYDLTTPDNQRVKLEPKTGNAPGNSRFISPEFKDPETGKGKNESDRQKMEREKKRQEDQERRKRQQRDHDDDDDSSRRK